MTFYGLAPIFIVFFAILASRDENGDFSPVLVLRTGLWLLVLAILWPMVEAFIS